MSARFETSQVPVPNSLLVADPDPVLRASICTVMERAGYQILSHVESADEVRRLLRKLQPTAVILGHPQADRELADKVRAFRSGSRAALLLLTPIPNLDWIRSVRASGADLLLGRPPREADLVAGLEMAIARRQDLLDLEQELTTARERLETASLIQRAKEQLMRAEKITDGEAFERLRRQAERTGRPLRSIAEAVVLAASITPAA